MPGFDGIGERNFGFARVGRIRLGTMRRDLVLATADIEADGAEFLALRPQRIGDVADDALDLVGSCGGRGIEVDGRRVDSIGGVA